MFKQIFVGMLAVAATAISCDSDDDTNSNSVTPKATITGGPFNFTVDLKEDKITEGAISVKTEGDTGAKKGWIVTDESNKILGLPPNPSVVDFNVAGVGTCFVWYIGYQEGLEGLEKDKNVEDLKGEFVLSNAIEVVRSAPNGGSILTGGPFDFIVGDGNPDSIAAGAITVDDSNAIGSEKAWVVTDETATTILGVPGDFTGPNFDDAGEGVCYIWRVNYNPGVTGLEKDKLLADVNGTIYLSNPVKIVREN